MACIVDDDGRSILHNSVVRNQSAKGVDYVFPGSGSIKEMCYIPGRYFEVLQQILSELGGVGHSTLQRRVFGTLVVVDTNDETMNVAVE